MFSGLSAQDSIAPVTKGNTAAYGVHRAAVSSNDADGIKEVIHKKGLRELRGCGDVHRLIRSKEVRAHL